MKLLVVSLPWVKYRYIHAMLRKYILRVWMSSILFFEKKKQIVPRFPTQNNTKSFLSEVSALDYKLYSPILPCAVDRICCSFNVLLLLSLEYSNNAWLFNVFINQLINCVNLRTNFIWNERRVLELLM